MHFDDIPARTDPCWQDDAWRRARLKELKAEHRLVTAQIAEMAGVGTRSAENWFSHATRPIPANSLRMLMLELAVQHGR